MLHHKGKNHGRIEKREYRLLRDLSWLSECREWNGLRAVGMAASAVTRNDETSIDMRYFITFLTNIDMFSNAVQRHWSIKNQLHWSLDVIFCESKCRAKKDLSPLNMNILKKTALALCENTDMGKRVSTQKKIQGCHEPRTFFSYSPRYILNAITPAIEPYLWLYQFLIGKITEHVAVKRIKKFKINHYKMR